MDAAVEAYLKKGGKITRVPRSKRTLNDTHIDLLCKADMVNLVAYETVRQDELRDRAGRRAQRGKKQCR